jgi:hypothetical protein
MKKAIITLFVGGLVFFGCKQAIQDEAVESVEETVVPAVEEVREVEETIDNIVQ